MHGNSWEQTKDTLLDVLAVEPAKRSEFIGGLGLSPERQTEIESLIAFDSFSDSILDTSALELAADLIAPDPTDENICNGRVIGKYRVIDELGIGGMGAVYLAERFDGKITQRVAIKLLRREFNAAKIREMFGRERDIHSRLEHPNIAHVIDAGSTYDDIPFLVMEYVEGSPIDQYCRDRRLGIIELLKLFNKVCGAVAFAHRNLIIHRDLK
ncbi:MAG: protein kinase, partial [Pyrinomonadaceae bacterium]